MKVFLFLIIILSVPIFNQSYGQEVGDEFDSLRSFVVIFFVLVIGGSILFFSLHGRKKKSGTIIDEYDRLTASKIPKEKQDYLPKSKNVNDIFVQYPNQGYYKMYSTVAFDINIVKPYDFDVEMLEDHRNIKSGKHELFIIPLEIGNAIEIHEKNTTLYLPIGCIHQFKWKPDINSNVCELPYFDVPPSEWNKIDSSNEEKLEESEQIVDSNTHWLKFKIKDSQRENFYKTLQAFRIKEYDERYWETTSHGGIDIPYKTPFLGVGEQLLVSYDGTTQNSIIAITNHRVFSYDFDRHVVDGYLLWSQACDVTIMNSHNTSISVGSGSIIGTSSSGMRIGTFGGIGQSSSKTVGDLLFLKDGKIYHRINNVAGPSGVRQTILSIIRSYR